MRTEHDSTSLNSLQALLEKIINEVSQKNQSESDSVFGAFFADVEKIQRENQADQKEKADQEMNTTINYIRDESMDVYKAIGSLSSFPKDGKKEALVAFFREKVEMICWNKKADKNPIQKEEQKKQDNPKNKLLNLFSSRSSADQEEKTKVEEEKKQVSKVESLLKDLFFPQTDNQRMQEEKIQQFFSHLTRVAKIQVGINHARLHFLKYIPSAKIEQSFEKERLKKGFSEHYFNLNEFPFLDYHSFLKHYAIKSLESSFLIHSCYLHVSIKNQFILLRRNFQKFFISNLLSSESVNSHKNAKELLFIYSKMCYFITKLLEVTLENDLLGKPDNIPPSLVHNYLKAVGIESGEHESSKDGNNKTTSLSLISLIEKEIPLFKEYRTGLESSLQLLEKRVNELKSELDAEEAKLKKKKDQFDNEEKAQMEKADVLNKKKQELDNRESSLSKSEDELTLQKNHLNKLEKELSDKSGRLDQEEKRLRKKDNDLFSEQEKINKEKDTLSLQQKELFKIKKELAQKESENNRASQELQAFSLQLRKEEEVLSNTRTYEKELKAALQETKNKLQEAENNLKKIQEREQLRKLLNKLKNRLNFKYDRKERRNEYHKRIQSWDQNKVIHFSLFKQLAPRTRTRYDMIALTQGIVSLLEKKLEEYQNYYPIELVLLGLLIMIRDSIERERPMFTSVMACEVKDLIASIRPGGIDKEQEKAAIEAFYRFWSDKKNEPYFQCKSWKLENELSRTNRSLQTGCNGVC